MISVDGIPLVLNVSSIAEIRLAPLAPIDLNAGAIEAMKVALLFETAIVVLEVGGVVIRVDAYTRKEDIMQAYHTGLTQLKHIHDAPTLPYAARG